MNRENHLYKFRLVRYLLSIVFVFLSVVLIGQDFSLSFSHGSGVYEEGFDVSIEGTFDKLYYTLDGSNPKNGKRYKKPITVDENTVLRVVPYHNGVRLDTFFLRTYLFDFSTKLPIISVAIEDSAFWSSSYGIYAKGNNAYYNDSTQHWENCNFQQKWEREMHVEYIDTNAQNLFNQVAGIRIFGETTRRYPEKSMKIVARGEYGVNRFYGSVFPLKPHLDEHKQFVLRTSGNDYRGTRFKDCLNAYLVKDIGLDYMAFQPVQLFINGQYWGLYNLREKVNKHYLCYNRNADFDSSSIIMGRWVRQHGSARDYMRMYRFFEHLDTMDNRAYEKASSMLDTRNYINYRVTQIFLNNSDSRGNIRYWNSKDLDGKFRMILYDTDHSHGQYNRNYLEASLSESKTHWFNPKWSTMYLTRLMQHPDFKTDFVNQFAHLLNTNLHPDTINKAVDYFVELYKDELPRDPAKLPRNFRNSALEEEEWLENVASIRKFARLRNQHIIKEIKRLLAPRGTYILKIEGDSGKVIINNNNAVTLPYTGRYFKGFDLPVRMKTDNNWEFVSWSDGVTDSVRIVSGTTDTVVLSAAMNFISDPVEEVEKPVEDEEVAEIQRAEKSGIDPLIYLAYGLIGLGLVLLILHFVRRP